MTQFLALKIPFGMGEVQEYIYPAVLQGETHTVLFDCGYVGALPVLEAALLKDGVAPESITHIILTHHDHDHVGALAAFQAKYPHVLVAASVAEAAYISGVEKSPRLLQAEALQVTLPPEGKAFGEQFMAVLKRVEPAKVDILLTPGETLELCGGIQIIDTHGHTPGHIAAYLQAVDTLVAGDAAYIENGVLAMPNPRFTLDFERAAADLALIRTFPCKNVLCYHSGLFINENMERSVTYNFSNKW